MGIQPWVHPQALGKARVGAAPSYTAEFAVEELPKPTNSGPSEDREAESISCVRPQACVVVGTYWNYTEQAHATLAEIFNGSEWSVQSTPNPAGAVESSLDGVSCLAATECFAVGHYETSSHSKLTLVERW